MRVSADSLHSTRNGRSWQARFLVAGLLLLLTVVYFWRQVVLGQALYWGDTGLYFTPMAGFLKQNLNAGRLPLWNPLILCGTPYVGNPQTWPLYPATALLPFVSATQFLNLTVALHTWIAGLGVYAFARRALALGVGPALLAAVTFMFGGQLVSKEQFPNMVQASAWLPWILLCLDSLLWRRRVQDALVLGTVLGLQLLAAHVQMTLLTLYLAAAYGVFVWRGGGTHPGSFLAGPPETGGRRALDLGDATASHSFPLRFGEGAEERGRGGSPARLRETGGLIFLALITASGLAMDQLLPTLALFRDAARHRLSFAVVDRFFLPFNQLGNFVLPHLHGSPFYGNWTARGNAWETCCYVGGLSFGLALWGGFTAFRSSGRSARFWVGVFGVSLWMAFGGRGGLYHLAYFVLPGFRSFHDPARCLLPACFALSLLAGFGLEQLLQKGKRAMEITATEAQSPPARTQSSDFVLTGAGRFSAFVAAILIARRQNGLYLLVAGLILLAFADLMHFGRTLYPLAEPSALRPLSPNIARVQADPDITAHQARILAPTNGVWLRFTNYKDFRQSAPDYQELWADTLTPNLMMSYGIYDAFGYEPVALRKTETAAKKAADAFEPKATQAQRNEAAALCGALGVKYIALLRVTPPETAVPGLAAVRVAPTVAPPGQKRGPKAFVYLSRDLRWQARAHLVHSPSPVALTEDGPDRVRLSFRTSAPDTLILEDAQAAGWSAFLDGHAEPIDTYDGCLRAVAVPSAGLHTLRFLYASTPFRLGFYVSLLTLALLTGAGSFGIARKLVVREGFQRPRAE